MVWVGNRQIDVIPSTCRSDCKPKHSCTTPLSISVVSYSDWHAGQAKKKEGGVEILLCCVGHCLLVACQLVVICVHACLCFVVVHEGAYSVHGINIVVLQREPCFFKAELAKTRPQNRGHFSAQKSRTFLDTPYMGYRQTSAILGPQNGPCFGAALVYTGLLLVPFHLTHESLMIVCLLGYLSPCVLNDFWEYVQSVFPSKMIYLLSLYTQGVNSSTDVGRTCQQQRSQQHRSTTHHFFSAHWFRSQLNLEGYPILLKSRF